MIDRYVFKVFAIGFKGSDLECFLNQDLGCSLGDTAPLSIGVNFTAKRVILNEEEAAKLQIWSMSHGPEFNITFPAFILGSQALVLLFNVYDSDFITIAQNIIHNTRMFIPNIPIFLLGNKTDENFNNNNQDIMNKFCRDNKCNYLNYISMKTGEDFKDFYNNLTSSLIRLISQ